MLTHLSVSPLLPACPLLPAPLLQDLEVSRMVSTLAFWAVPGFVPFPASSQPFSLGWLG